LSFTDGFLAPRPPTYKLVGILLQPDSSDEIRTFVRRPFRYNGLGQPVCTGAIAIGRRGRLVGWRIRVDGGLFGIGLIDGRAVGEFPLVLVVGVRLRVRCPRVEIHGRVVWRAPLAKQGQGQGLKEA